MVLGAGTFGRENLGDLAPVPLNNHVHPFLAGGEFLNKINRRDFLKKALAGSAAVALAPSFIDSLSPFARATTPTNPMTFQLAAISVAPIVDGVEHRIAMSGDGLVTPGNISAGGSFTHYDNAGTKDPKTILQSGDWKATDLLSFNLIGTWGEGPFSAGTIEMNVDLNRDFPSELVIPATLKLNANLGSGGLTTGEPEGFTLTVPSALYGPFKPLGGKKKSKKKKKGFVLINNHRPS